MGSESTPNSWADQFSAYFSREVAQRAAKSIADGAEIELQIAGAGAPAPDEVFSFTRQAGSNLIRDGASTGPDLTFKMTPEAAKAILSEASEEIGRIGVNIAKLMISPDASKRVTFKIHAGFFALFTKGYFGVLTSGGGEFGAFLAERGLSGVNAIKNLLKKKDV